MKKKAIVIGTGAGGLAATVGLARAGYEVTAYEAAKQLGGHLNPFARRHYKFDPGLHYVGKCAQGKSTHESLSQLGLVSEEVFAEMDPDGFDVVKFPGFEFKVPKGIDNYCDRLREHFPSNAKDIEKVRKLLKRANAYIDGLFDTQLHGISLRHLYLLQYMDIQLKHGGGTFQDVLNSVTKNPRLRSVLAAQAGDYCIPPSQTPAMLGLGVLLHFLDGAHFPYGGSGTLRDALVSKGYEYGAVFHRRKEVKRILLKDGKAIGVELASGEWKIANVIVSAVDPAITYGKLIGFSELPKRLVKTVKSTQPSISSFCVFLGMERNLREYGLGASNIWQYQTWDVNQTYAPLFKGRMPDKPILFLSPNSLKDPTGKMAPEGCSTLEIVTFAPYSHFQDWEDSKSMKRGEEYKAKKAAYAERILDDVTALYPDLIGDVKIKDSSTGLSSVHFVNSIKGGAYGPVPRIGQGAQLRYRTTTPIKGLYLAGAAVFGGGVGPSLMSGVVAARRAKNTS